MQDEEVGVSLKDVLVYCFLHWRSAIAVVLVGALLGGGYYAYKDRAAASSVATEEVEEQTSAAEYVELALADQRSNILQQGDYLENSLLMRIDPNDEHVSSANLVVSASSEVSSQQVDALVVSYASSIMASSALDALAVEWDTTPAYLRELVTLDASGRAGITAPNVSSTSAGDSADGGPLEVVVQSPAEVSGAHAAVLSVTAMGSTAEEATAVRDALLAGIDAAQDELSGAIAPHAVAVVDRTDYVIADYALLVQQTSRANAISNAQSTLTNNENAAPEVAEESVATDAISLKSLLKGGIIGGVATFLLYGFVLCLRYVLDATPVMRGQVEARYALPEVGSYAYGAEAFYRGGTGFDRWLRKLSGLEAAPDPAEVAEMVAANVRLYAEKAETILVSSSVASDSASALAEALGERLADKEFVLANALVASADARGRLKSADAVIFVEEYGRSTYEDIDAEITLAAETGKAPLGLVMA